MRLERSECAETFVLKDGLLISSMTGVSQRTTMDMDATVVGMDMDETAVSKAVAAICAVAADDGMEYSFERIEPIREGDEYANWRAHLRVRYGKIDAPHKDRHHHGRRDSAGAHRVPLPAHVRTGEVRVLSYPLETVLVEKLETVVSRGVENTRGRDFYDIHVLLALKSDGIDVESLHEAVIATASRRGSLRKMAGCEVVLEEVKGSSIMRGVWAAYVSGSPYAAGIDFEEAVDSALRLASLSGLDELS